MSTDASSAPAATPTDLASAFALNQWVKVKNFGKGIVRYIGRIHVEGTYIGVEIVEFDKGKKGKNDGSVPTGERFFRCPPERGVFVKPDSVFPCEPNPEASTNDPPSAPPASRASSDSTSVPSSAPVATRAASFEAAPKATVTAAPAAAPAATPMAAAPGPAAGHQPLASSHRPSVASSQQPAASFQQRGTAAAKTVPTPASAPATTPPAAPSTDTAKRLSDSVPGVDITVLLQERQQLESKIADLQQERDRLNREVASEQQQLAQAKLRRDEGRTKEDATATESIDGSEREAQAQLDKARNLLKKLTASVAQRRREKTVLQESKQHLERRNQTLAGNSEEELQKQLESTRMERLLKEEQLAELQLELAELEMKLDDIAQERARLTCASTTNEKTLEYQAAIRIFKLESGKREHALRSHVEELDKTCSFETDLKTQRESLSRKQNQLHEHMAALEQEDAQLAQLSKTGHLLHELQADVVLELRRELDCCNERVDVLEDLVRKLHREWKEISIATASDRGRATDLLQEVQTLATAAAAGSGQSEGSSAATEHARAAAAGMEHSLAKLQAVAANVRATAYMKCIPAAWLPKSEGGVGVKTSVQKVVQSVTFFLAAERCLCHAVALGKQAQSLLMALKPADPAGALLSQLCIVSWRCASAATGVQVALSSPSVSAEKLKDGCIAGGEQLNKILDALRGRQGPDKLGPQAIDELQNVQVRLRELCSLGSQAPAGSAASCRETAFLLRRLEAAYGYGLVAFSQPSIVTTETTSVTVMGGADPSMAPLLAGKYRERGEHHGKPVFEKEELVSGQVVHIYFWDDPVPENCGWYMAPSIGGDLVWAFVVAPASSMTPPLKDWKVPFNGPPDPTFEVIYSSSLEQGAGQSNCVQQEQLVAWRLLRGRLARMAARLEVQGRAVHDAAHTEEEGHLLQLPDLLLQHLSAFEEQLAGSQGKNDALQVLGQMTSEAFRALDLLEHGRSARRGAKVGTATQVAAGELQKSKWGEDPAELQCDIKAVFDIMHEVGDMTARVQEQQRTLEVANQQLSKAVERRASLQKELGPLCQQAAKSAALGEEAAELRSVVQRAAAAEAALAQEHDDVCERVRQQELGSQQVATRCEELEQSLKILRGGGVRQEGEVRMTLQQFTTLRRACEKNAREIYAHALRKVDTLTPLPPTEPSTSSETRSLQECLGKFAGLRQELLHEWTGVRLSRLSAGAPPPISQDLEKPVMMQHTAAKQAMATQVDKIRQLQLKVADIRAAVTPLAASAPPATAALKATAAGTAVAKVQLQVPCPKWASPLVSDLQFPVTLGEFREIHNHFT